MNKAREYRRNAKECRRLAATMGADEHRQQLLNMAATWEHMAQERERSPLRDEDRSFDPKRR